MVHLLGTHMKYKYRYPDDYALFSGRDGVPEWVKDEDLETYNQYDNAVRYNDHVVHGLISALGKDNPDGFLLYLSDHGEDVFDHPDRYFIGRNEGSPSSSMYSIPFLIWTSPRWKEKHSVRLSDYEDRVYSSADLLHTWVDLSGIRFDEWRPERSLVNPGFVMQPVWIGNPARPKSLREVRELGWLDPHEKSPLIARRKLPRRVDSLKLDSPAVVSLGR